MAVFVAVVEQGSFTAAAEYLELSKAVVSKYLSRLESRLGTRLLNRTTRRITLTETGKALYERSSLAIQDLEAAEKEVIAMSGVPRGRLRVTAPVYFAQEFLGPMLSSFCQKYPEIELDLDLDNRRVDLVEEAFDVGVRISTLTDSSLVARRLAEIRLMTLASPEYLRRMGMPQDPADLRHHHCLHYGLQRIPHEWRFQRGGQMVTVRTKGVFRSNNDAMLKQAALNGQGLLRFPDIFVTEELASGALVAVLQPFEIQTSSLSVVFPTRRNMAPKVRVFVEHLVEAFGQHLAT